jgi:superfamily II DNA or RNA helicase
MKKELWAHQKYAIEKYKDREFFGLLFSMGLGKSLTATRIAEAKQRPVLIIAPNALCNQWKEELTNKKDDRITTEEWDVLVCTSKTKNTKKFKQAFEEFCRK